MTTGIEVSGLDEFDAKLQKLVDGFPELRREMHEEMAQMLEQEIGMAIGNSVVEHTGALRSWQQSRVGSGGGYAAVSPITGRRGRDSYGKITNAVENGHTIRRPSGNAKRYRARIKTLRVDGRHFYAAARAKAATKAQQIAQKYVNQMIDGLEG